MLIATPDHWHALPMIEAVRGGLDVWVQKPISVDVVEGPGDAGGGAQVQARRAGRHAAAQHAASRRRPRPRHSRRQARHHRPGRDLLLLPHAGDRPTRPIPRRRRTSITRCGPDRRRCGPYNQLVHPRSWRAFMEYGNGIVGDMCVHMLDMVRWMLDLGMPARISSAGGILVDKKSKANITDTQTATFDYPNLKVVWTHRSYGDPPDPKYPWGGHLLRRQGDAQGERHELRLRAVGQGRPARSRRRHLRVRAVSRGQDREGPRDARRGRRCART